MVYIFASRLLRMIFKIKTNSDDNYNNLKNKRVLIVANHVKRVDPFVILASLNFSNFRSLVPIRFFTANIYLQTFGQNFFYYFLGCFEAYSIKNKLSGLKGSLVLSDAGFNLMIFPQGRRSSQLSLTNLKIGPGYLTIRRNFQIVPVYIEYQSDRTIVNWGAAFTITKTDKKKNIEMLTKYIFSKIIELKKI